MKILFLLIFISLKSFSALASSKIYMDQISKDLGRLFPILFNDHKPLSKSETQKIQLSLDLIGKNLSKMKDHFISHNAPMYMVSQEVMKEYIDEIKDLLSTNAQKARKMAQNIPSMCINCHSSDKKSFSMYRSIDHHNFFSDFLYAEYNFMTRNYKKALLYYDRTIRFNGEFDNNNNVITSLKRELTLFVQLLEDPQSGISKFKGHLANNKLHRNYKIKIKDWIDSLSNWQRDKRMNKPSLIFRDIEKLANRYLDLYSHQDIFKVSNKDIVFYLRLLASIHTFLTKKAKYSERAPLLFWMAVAQRGLGQDFAYPMANLYLKECIKIRPKTQYTEKCRIEYLKYLNFYYADPPKESFPNTFKSKRKKIKKNIGILNWDDDPSQKHK